MLLIILAAETLCHAACDSLRIRVHRHRPWHHGCMRTDSDRSLEPIELADLLRLAALAADAEAELFERNPHGSGRYAGRLLGRALCQGAALHYVNGSNGVKDFDVWSFYAQHNDWPFPARWRGTRDFGSSKFGRYPGDPPGYSGRRVDLLGRSLPVGPGTDPADALRGYLAARRTGSARALAAKAVILIDPENRAGEIVWPASAEPTSTCLSPARRIGSSAHGQPPR
jgi:hypothetical protein